MGSDEFITEIALTPALVLVVHFCFLFDETIPFKGGMTGASCAATCAASGTCFRCGVAGRFAFVDMGDMGILEGLL